jgi:hypothetical protein
MKDTYCMECGEKRYTDANGFCDDCRDRRYEQVQAYNAERRAAELKPDTLWIVETVTDSYYDTTVTREIFTTEDEAVDYAWEKKFSKRFYYRGDTIMPKVSRFERAPF